MTEQFYGYNAFEKGFYYDDGESCVPVSNEDIVNQLNKYMKRNWELIDEKEDLKRTNSQLKKVNIEGSKQVEKLERENEKQLTALKRMCDVEICQICEHNELLFQQTPYGDEYDTRCKKGFQDPNGKFYGEEVQDYVMAPQYDYQR